MKKYLFHKTIAFILLLAPMTNRLLAQELLITDGTLLMAHGSPWITLVNLSWTNDGGVYGGFHPSDSKVAIKRNAGPDIHLRGSKNTNFHHLVVNPGDGVFRLEQDVYIYARLDFGGTMISIGDHQITLGPQAVLGSDNLETQLTGNNGRIMITVPLNAPYRVNPGNLGLEITTNSHLGQTTIIRGFREQLNAAGEKSIMRYFDVIPSHQPTDEAKLRLQYSDRELNGNSREKLAVFGGSPGSRLQMIAGNGYEPVANWVSVGKVDLLQRFTLGNAIASPASEVVAKATLKVYPNPFRDRFTISIVSNLPRKAELKIISVSGAVIERRSVQLNAGNNLIEWSTSGYINGAYYLVSDNEISKAIKIMKQ